MKKLFALLLVTAFAMPVIAAEEAPKTKEVCKEVKGKNGKPVKQCKTIKIHKKHEGTKVEGTKPDVQPKKK